MLLSTTEGYEKLVQGPKTLLDAVPEPPGSAKTPARRGYHELCIGDIFEVVGSLRLRHRRAGRARHGTLCTILLPTQMVAPTATSATIAW